MKSFSERLREERTRLNLNQTEFAALGRVTKSTQANYEKGGRSPDADYLMALLPHGVDVYYLLVGVPGEAVARGLAPGQVRVLAAFDQMSAADQAVALRVLEALAIHSVISQFG